MIRVRPALSLLALSALAACSGHDYTPREFYSILPDLVRFADSDARQNAGGRPPAGPLYVDAKSFAGAGGQLVRQRLTADSVMAHLGNPAAVLVEKPQDALVIQDTGSVAASTADAQAGVAGGRWVKGYGVLVHMNLVKADNQEMAAVVTSFATDRRSWPTGICRRIQRVTYQRDAAGGWRRVKNELRKGCDDPDEV
jgi:hypothetical protein